MRTIERTTGFKKDFKRELKGRYKTILDEELTTVLGALIIDRPLEARYRDHDLSNNWSGYRECHIKPDLLLIYRKCEDQVLKLARLGSHSELFG